MLLSRWVARLLLGAALLLAGARMVREAGLGGEAEALAEARRALQALGFAAAGDATVALEGDHALAWALERSRPGRRGVELARREGGAVRWRVRFAGGGEASVTVGTMLWSVRRPVPTAAGPDLFPVAARGLLEAAAPRLMGAEAQWLWAGAQTWREQGRTWYRARFLGAKDVLPAGWRRELELELVGSTLVGARQWVHPLGTDLGVVMGRMAELRLLALAGAVSLAVLAIGMLLAGAEAYAFRERTWPVRGLLLGLLVAGFGLLAGREQGELLALAVVAAVAVTLLPMWTELPPSRPELGAPAGLALAVVAASAPGLVVGVGGWMPTTPELLPGEAPLALLAAAWLPALVEEPLLRGALPGLVAPIAGWWGAAAASVAMGALLHAPPAVPLVAALGVEAVLQLGLVVIARHAGLGGALLARGTLESLILRQGLPRGVPADAAALAGLALGAVLLLLARRRE
ncbi:MAG: hypothetical protein V1750_09325 [Acidobacteriota bacterium]